jgi:ketosteroid isomerase-like protein/quercetin dioxygenase-like cupin family protein
MKRYACVVGLAVLLAGGCAKTVTVNVEQERTALMERDRAWSQTTKDPNQFLSFFTSDGSVYAPGMPLVTGTDALRKTYTEMSSAPGFSLTWSVSKAEVSASGDMGYTAGSYKLAMGGAPETGKYITIWRKEGTEWKVVEDIFNADTAGPPVEHEMVAPSALVWGDSPPGLPAGAKVAVVSGDPAQPGPFVLRVMAPAGFTVPPHWHPTAEHLTVIAGTVAIGMGDKADPAAMTTLDAGGYAVLPADMRHTFVSTTASTFQVQGTGPFAITYVNPADDPRLKK